MTEERKRQILSVILPYIRRNVKEVPVPVEKLCEELEGVHLVAPEQIQELFDRQTAEKFREMDAVTVTLAGGRKLIVYDSGKPKTRVRFSLAHELAHILLGHCDGPNPDSMEYAAMEEEANRAAGLIVCPPKLYYGFSDRISSRDLAEICGVSESCARLSMLSLKEDRELIGSFAEYRFMKTPELTQGSRNTLMSPRPAYGNGRK